MADAYAEINGQSQRIIGGSYSVGWGTPPGACGLAVGYSFTDPGRVVTLEIKFRDRTITLRDALVVDPRAAGSVTQTPLVNFSVLDRRWRWLTAGRINGNYNEETAENELLRQRNPQQLAELLYLALGEAPGSFDVDALPIDPRPATVWEAADPREELERLCADFGCVPLFDPIDDRCYIAVIGEGDGPPADLEQVISIGKARVLPTPPSGFRGVCGPTLFQTALALGEPVGVDVDGSLKPINQLSYTPAGGWSAIDPWDFRSLNSTYTDAATGETLYHRDLAIGSVWRKYRISGQAAGGFSPQVIAGGPWAPQSIKDLGPFTGDLLDRDLATGERLPAFARGLYADERLGYDNTAPNSRFPGSITIDSEKRVVSFDRPLFKYGAGDAPEPADVVLVAAYAISRDGVPYRHELARAAPGAGAVTAGEVVEVRDEIIREIIEARASATGRIRDNHLEVDQKLDYYLDALERQTRESLAANITFGGLKRFRLGGQLRSITWAFSASEVPTTQCSWNTERSRAVIPWDKRTLARAMRRVEYWQRQNQAAKRVAASRESAIKKQ